MFLFLFFVGRGSALAYSSKLSSQSKSFLNFLRIGKRTSLFVKKYITIYKIFLGKAEGTYLFAKIVTQVFKILFGCENALAYLWKIKLGQEKVFKILANEWMEVG